MNSSFYLCILSKSILISVLESVVVNMISGPFVYRLITPLPLAPASANVSTSCPAYLHSQDALLPVLLSF